MINDFLMEEINLTDKRRTGLFLYLLQKLNLIEIIDRWKVEDVLDDIIFENEDNY